MESTEGINKLFSIDACLAALSSAFLDIIILEVDQIVVLDETCSWRGSPVLAAFLAHLSASGEALSLSATRVLPEAAG